MKIKKLGHCCLVIEMDGKKIMTDPSFYTAEKQSKEFGINLILVTHEHSDHLHIESLKKVLVNNPNALVITNSGVGKLLTEARIKYEVLENKIAKQILSLEIEAHDCRHEEIFEEYGQVQNTGYFIGRRLFYPGDSFYNPGKPVEILAVGVAGPWSKVKDVMKYVLNVNPKICFPVHDGVLTPYAQVITHKPFELILPKFGIIFKNFRDNDEEKF